MAARKEARAPAAKAKAKAKATAKATAKAAAKAKSKGAGKGDKKTKAPPREKTPYALAKEKYINELKLGVQTSIWENIFSFHICGD